MCAKLSLASIVLVVALVPSLASAIEPKSFEEVRAETTEGVRVTVMGRVIETRSSRFFTLEDESRQQMIVVIPNSIIREQGKPEHGEMIRVRGKYGHATLVDSTVAETSDPDTTWGIRVSSLERNMPTTGRNPSAAAAEPVKPLAATPPSPAAPAGAAAVHSPTVSAEMKERLAAARRAVMDARSASEDADAEVARAMYQGVEGPEMDALVRKQKDAEGRLAAAVSEVPPLVEEARAAGVGESVIELYEKGVTQPRK